MSTHTNDNGVHGAVLGGGTDEEMFGNLFPQLVKDLMSDGEVDPLVKDACLWYKRVNEYNVPHGKRNRGLTVLHSYRYLLGDRVTNDGILNACVIGWCIEWLQAYFLVADDIMDSSITRRGQPCWHQQSIFAFNQQAWPRLLIKYKNALELNKYKNLPKNSLNVFIVSRQLPDSMIERVKKDVGLIAVNDALHMESAVYVLLRKYIKGQPYYTDILELFLEMNKKTVIGQTLDMITAPTDHVDFSCYTLERYQTIVKYKTAFYSFYLPVAAAMYMAGINDKNSHENAKTILLQMGEYFQIQDDYIDCYGDPAVTGKIGTDIEDNKCSWIVVQALQRVTPQQRTILENNYAKKDEKSVAVVKSLFNELNLEKVYQEYEEQSYQHLMKLIDEFCAPSGPENTTTLPRDMFIAFARKIYRRQK